MPAARACDPFTPAAEPAPTGAEVGRAGPRINLSLPGYSYALPWRHPCGIVLEVAPRPPAARTRARARPRAGSPWRGASPPQFNLSLRAARPSDRRLRQDSNLRPALEGGFKGAPWSPASRTTTKHYTTLSYKAVAGVREEGVPHATGPRNGAPPPCVTRGRWPRPGSPGRGVFCRACHRGSQCACLSPASLSPHLSPFRAAPRERRATRAPRASGVAGSSRPSRPARRPRG